MYIAINLHLNSKLLTYFIIYWNNYSFGNIFLNFLIFSYDSVS